jgi:hypothetical protein
MTARTRTSSAASASTRFAAELWPAANRLRRRACRRGPAARPPRRRSRAARRRCPRAPARTLGDHLSSPASRHFHSHTATTAIAYGSHAAPSCVTRSAHASWRITQSGDIACVVAGRAWRHSRAVARSMLLFEWVTAMSRHCICFRDPLADQVVFVQERTCDLPPPPPPAGQKAESKGNCGGSVTGANGENKPECRRLAGERAIAECEVPRPRGHGRAHGSHMCLRASVERRTRRRIEPMLLSRFSTSALRRCGPTRASRCGTRVCPVAGPARATAGRPRRRDSPRAQQRRRSDVPVCAHGGRRGLRDRHRYDGPGVRLRTAV